MNKKLILICLLLSSLLLVPEMTKDETMVATAADKKTINFSYYDWKPNGKSILNGSRAVVYDNSNEIVYIIQEFSKDVIKVDVSNKNQAKAIATLTLPNHERLTPVDAVLDGTKLYITAEAGESNKGGIFVVDLTQFKKANFIALPNIFHPAGIALRPSKDGTKKEIVVVDMGPSVGSKKDNTGCCGKLVQVTLDLKNNKVTTTKVLNFKLQTPFGLCFENRNIAFLVTHPPGDASRKRDNAVKVEGLENALKNALKKLKNNKDEARKILKDQGFSLSNDMKFTIVKKKNSRWEIIEKDSNGKDKIIYIVKKDGNQLTAYGKEKRGKLLRLNLQAKSKEEIAADVYGGTSVALAKLKDNKDWVLLTEFGNEGSIQDGQIRIVDPKNKNSWFSITPFNGIHRIAIDKKGRRGFVVEVNERHLAFSIFDLNKLTNAMNQFK